MPDTIMATGPATGGEEWGGELSAMESRAEVDSLEDLQRRRRKLVTENARLIALYGPFGLFDARRKQYVEAQKVVARQALLAAGQKATDSGVESEAYGSEAYQSFLDRSLDDRVVYLLVETELSEIAEKIKNRESALFLYGQEVRLAR